MIGQHDYWTLPSDAMYTNIFQDLNVLYQVCVFWGPRLKQTCQEARSQCQLRSLCFSGRSKKKIPALISEWLRHFQLLLCKTLNRIRRRLAESKSSMFFTKFVFFGPIGKARYRSEFNETWPEARSQRSLPKNL